MLGASITTIHKPVTFLTKGKHWIAPFAIGSERPKAVIQRIYEYTVEPLTLEVELIILRTPSSFLETNGPRTAPTESGVIFVGQFTDSDGHPSGTSAGGLVQGSSTKASWNHCSRKFACSVTMS